MAIGNTNDLKRANFKANELPIGKHSTLGLGRMVPTKSEDIEGARVFLGPIEDNGMYRGI